MAKALITVTITREIEYDPDFYETDLSEEEFLQEEIKYADNLFHEWIEADGVKFFTEGKLI